MTLYLIKWHLYVHKIFITRVWNWRWRKQKLNQQPCVSIQSTSKSTSFIWTSSSMASYPSSLWYSWTSIFTERYVSTLLNARLIYYRNLLLAAFNYAASGVRKNLLINQLVFTRWDSCSKFNKKQAIVAQFNNGKYVSHKFP